MDNTQTENRVNDLVSGFAIPQIFNALQSDVTTVQQYRDRLILQNPNSTANPNLSTQITTLFSSFLPLLIYSYFMKFFLIFFCILVFICGCHKPCNEPNYDFSVFESFTPEKDGMDIGDTLYLN